MNKVQRSYYSDYSKNFLKLNDEQILGKLTLSHPFELDINQKNAWIEEIKIMRTLAINYDESFICFEFRFELCKASFCKF